MSVICKTRQLFLFVLLLTGITELLAGEAVGVFYREGRTSLTLPVSGVVQEVLVKKGDAGRSFEVLNGMVEDARREAG